MPPLPKTEDLDDIQFKSTGKERDNELAVKLFKLREHLSSIHDAYEEQVKGALDCLRNHEGRGAVGVLSDGKKHMNTAFGNFIDECDQMLLLTGKKKVVVHANSAIVADQNNEKILKKAHLRSLGAVTPTEKSKEVNTSMSKVKHMNRKFAAKSDKSVGSISPSPKRISKRKRNKTAQVGNTAVKKFAPTIVDGESEVTIRLEVDKTIVLPNPSSTTYERIYSIRETLLYLPKYRGDGMYKLFNLLLEEGRVAFSLRTFRRHLKIFEEHAILPDDTTLRMKEGRPRDKDIKDLKELNDCVASHSAHGDDAMKNVSLAIKAKRFAQDGYKAKDPSKQTVHNNAFLTVVSDERVSEVDSKSLRILSMSRDTAVRSIRTFVSEVAVAIATCFIPGRWHDKPRDDELSDGVKAALILAEEYFECECRPIDPRYIFNFDDTGRFQYLGEGENVKVKKNDENIQ